MYIIHIVLLMHSSSNIGEFSKDVRMLAALEETESDGDKLLEAARRLAGAFSELLTAAQPGSAEVSSDLYMAMMLLSRSLKFFVLNGNCFLK